MTGGGENEMRHNWEELLNEYLKSSITSKTEFAKSKGINPSLFRRNTTDWPKKKRKKKSNSKNSNASKEKQKNIKLLKNLPAIICEDTNNLTEKQEIFCLYYDRNHNATLSAKKAGYSEKTAYVQGYQLLQKPLVRARVQALKELRRASIMFNEDDIVEQRMKIAFADITDVAKWGVEEYPITDNEGALIINPKTGNVLMGKRSYLNFNDSNDIDGSLIKEISMGRSGLKIKLEDKQRALEWLESYFEMNPKDKHKLEYDRAMLAFKERETKIKEF